MSEAGSERGACLVIGAGDGLGASIARAFAREGLRVCVTRRPRNTEAVDTLAEAIRAEGGEAYAFGLDARVEDDVAALIERIEREIGADRGARLQYRRQCAFPDRRDDHAGLFQGLGNGGACRVPRQPRGGAENDRTRPRAPSSSPARPRASAAARAFPPSPGRSMRSGRWRKVSPANWGRTESMSPMS